MRRARRGQDRTTPGTRRSCRSSGACVRSCARARLSPPRGERAPLSRAFKHGVSGLQFEGLELPSNMSVKTRAATNAAIGGFPISLIRSNVRHDQIATTTITETRNRAKLLAMSCRVSLLARPPFGSTRRTGGEATCLFASSSFLLQEWGCGGRRHLTGSAPAIRAEL